MPTFAYKCGSCDAQHDEQRLIDDRDNPATCPSCGATATRVFEAPKVMNVALPDGTRRFADVRSYRILENAKRRSKDQATKAAAEREMRQLTKSEE